jgi:hypothetical protein
MTATVGWAVSQDALPSGANWLVVAHCRPMMLRRNSHHPPLKTLASSAIVPSTNPPGDSASKLKVATV